MLPTENTDEKPISQVIKDTLDEALGQVKSSSFAVLYAIGHLVQKYPGEPITMATVSKASGIGERTVQVAIRELHKGMFLEITHTSVGNVYNFVPTVVSRGADFSGVSTTTKNISTTTTSTSTYLEEVEGNTKNTPGTSGTSADAMDHHLENRQVLENNLASKATTVEIPGSTTRKRMGIFDTEVRNLVEQFESYVIPHSKQRITPRRRKAFYLTAHWMILTQKRSVEQINEVLEFCFGPWSGYLPIYLPRGERKITRLAQIAHHFDDIVTAMGATHR